MSKVLSYLLDLGAELPTHAAGQLPWQVCRRAYDGMPATSALDLFNEQWGKDRFERDATGWPSEKQTDTSYGSTDMDGQKVRNGDRRFVRDQHGRLFSGRAYGGVNGQWYVVSDGGPWLICTAGNMFSVAPDYLSRRFVSAGADQLVGIVNDAVKRKEWRKVHQLSGMLARGQQQPMELR